MKRGYLPLLCAILLLCACAAPQAEPVTQPGVSGTQAAARYTEPEPAEPAPSWVESVAAAYVADLGLTAADGEAAIRAAYRSLVAGVHFADPVGLDIWRHLAEDPDTPIPYLENRALSPLVFGIGSCEDFAAALVLLLRAQGFEAEYVAGYTLSVHQIYVDHAWAVVRLDGSWYHLDPQLEQNVIRGNTLAYRYYLRGDEEMRTDHKWGENLIEYWADMPEAEQAAIRADHTPPACPAGYPRPEAEPVPPPQRPNMADVEAEINAIKTGSGRGELAPIPLNVEPPVLVAARHVTPPLLPQAVPAPTGYRRSLLEGARAALYDSLAAAAEQYPEQTGVPIPQELDSAGVTAAVEAFQADWPAFYWLRVSAHPAGGGRQLTLSADDPPAVLAEQRRQVEAVADAILAPLAGAADFDKARYIHDYLAGTVEYDTDTTRPHSGNIYGALVEGVAYCNGYAGAFQYLAHRAGLEVAYLTGTSLRGTAHAWNAVRLDGAWLYVDTTWDRPLKPEDGVYHDYFLINEEELRRDRRPHDLALLPPAPPGDASGYYERMGYAVGGHSADPAADLAAAFLAQLRAMGSYPAPAAPVFLELKVTGDGEDYTRWKELYIKNVFQVLQAMESAARAEGLPFTIAADTSVRCDFNDTMQVLTFYPKVASSG